MRAAKLAGSRWIAPIHSLGSLPARLAAILSRSTTWVGGSAQSIIRAMRRHHRNYFNQASDCARRSAVHRQLPVLILVDARLARGTACATGRRGGADPFQPAGADPGDRQTFAERTGAVSRTPRCPRLGVACGLRILRRGAAGALAVRQGCAGTCTCDQRGDARRILGTAAIHVDEPRARFFRAGSDPRGTRGCGPYRDDVGGYAGTLRQWWTISVRRRIHCRRRHVRAGRHAISDLAARAWACRTYLL